MEIETETHIGTLDLTPWVQTRSRRKEKVSKEGKTRENLHPMMDGDTDRDPHWSTGLRPPQGPNEEQKDEENEKGNKDCEGCDHPLIQGD